MNINTLIITALIVLLPGCGGGGGDYASATAPTTTVAPLATSTPVTTMPATTVEPVTTGKPVTLTAGSFFVIPANTTIKVPAGTMIMNSYQSSFTVYGMGNTINTQAGATISVPPSATGLATNSVVSGAASTGNQALNLSVTLLAGSASSLGYPATDGTGAAAILYGGGRLALDGSGNIIFSDSGHLKKVTQSGVVTTLSDGVQSLGWNSIAIDAIGNIFGSASVYSSGVSSLTSINKMPLSGIPTSVFSGPVQGVNSNGLAGGAMAVDAGGNLYLTDINSQKIAKFSAVGVWSVLAGSGATGNQDGVGSAASFNLTRGGDMPIDSDGNLYVVSGDAVRKISPAGAVTTVASGLTNVAGGYGALAIDKAGNLYAGSNSGFGIARISKDGSLIQFETSNSTVGFIVSMVADNAGNIYVGTRSNGAQILKVVFYD